MDTPPILRMRRKSHPLTGTLLLAAFLAGCAAPDVPPPDTQTLVPAQWSTPQTHNNGQIARTLRWQDYFADPGLQHAIATALQNNRDLRQAVLRVEEARASYGIQRSESLPHFDLGAQNTRGRVPGDLNISGQPVVSSEARTYVGLNSWELDLWGRVRNLNEAALQAYLATDAARQAVQASLIAEVADAYLGLLALDERVALAQATIASRERSRDIFQRRHDVGAISTLEFTQVETLLEQAQALGAQLQQARDAQSHALDLLLGQTDPIADRTRPSLYNDDFFAPLQVGLPSEVLVLRPDIVAAEHKLQGAQANIAAARAAFFPRIALTGTLGTASAELGNLFQAGSRSWSFMPSITLPIFDGGRLRANLDLAEVRSDLAVAEYEKAIQNAFREVADALSAREWLSQRVEIQRKAVLTQTRRAELAQLRYDSGAAAYLEVLDAERDLLDAQQQLVLVRQDLLSSHVALYAALGGGTTTANPTPPVTP